MSPVILIALAVISVIAILFVSGIEGHERRSGALSLHMVSWVILTGALWTWHVQDSSDVSGINLTVSAQSAEGNIVATVVSLEEEGKTRKVRSIPLKNEFGGVLGLTGLGWILSTLVMLVGVRRAPTSIQLRIAQGAGLLHFLVAGALVFLTQPVADLGGETGIRSYLSSFDPNAAVITSFTIPNGTWTFSVPFQSSFWFVFVASVLALVMPKIKPLGTTKIPLMGMATMVCIGALAYQGFQTQGFPWRPTEAALFACVILSAGGTLLERQHQRLSVVTLGSAIGVLALVV